MLRSRTALAVVLALAASLESPRGQAQEPPRQAPAPALVPPQVREVPTLTLPPDTLPVPDGSGVTLMLVVSPDGTVREAEVVESLRDDLDAEVLRVVQSMQFEPATRDGVPIPARIRFRFAVTTPPPESHPETPPDDPSASPPDPADEDSPEAPTEPVEEDDPDPAVFGARAEVDRPEAGAASRITLTGAELSTVPGTFGEPLRVVATLPGVVRSPFGLGFFLVRGANFQNTGFFVDGFAVPILYHFGAGPAVLSSRLVERMRFYPGGYPSSLGRYSAGVVSLETGAPASITRPHAEVEIDLLRASLLGVLPYREGSLAIAFRRSYYELLLPAFVQGLYVAYTDYQIRWEHRIDEHVRFSLFAFGSDDILDQSGALMGGATSEGTNTRVNYNFQRLIGRIDIRPTADSFVRVAAALGRNGTSFGSRTAGMTGQQLDLESFELGLRVDASVPVAPWLRANFGLDAGGSVFGISLTAPAPTGLGEYVRPAFDPVTIQLSARVARGTPALYAEGVLDLAPFEIALGTRVELLRWGTLTSLSADPRLVARWALLPELTIKAATGLFTQPPNTFQTIAAGGNPSLGPQRAWQSSYGVEAHLPESIELEANAFYSQMFDIARFSQQIVPGPDGTPRREFFRADQEGRAYGFELLIRRPVEQGFYGWLSYTLSRSERLNPTGGWQTFGFDQTHVLNLAASYAFDGWRFGATFQLATGRPVSSPTNIRYDADENAYDATFVNRGDRLPLYHQLNVRIDREFDLDIVRGLIYLDVLNVYYGQNSEGLVYQYDYARSVPIPGLPILGTLGLRAEFEP